MSVAAGYDPFALAPARLWTADQRGQRADFNRAWEDFTGVSSDAARGDGWLITVHPDDRERVAQAWQDTLATTDEFVLDLRMRRADGVKLSTDELSDGARVLTERRLVEQALVHLVLNARDATAGSGEVQVKVESGCPGPAGDERPRVRIALKDDGRGMDE